MIQARMGSERLPRKMMQNLGGYPILDWVINRVSQSKLVTKVAIATSSNAKDDKIEELAKKRNIFIFRGDENDVLGRFYKASVYYGANKIVRICADNPFISPIEIDRLINYFNQNNFEYVCNHRNIQNSNYADGFGAEIFSFDLIKKLNNNVKDAFEREHVTLNIHNNLKKYKIFSIPAPKEVRFPDLRFDVDTKSDLEKLENLCRKGVNFQTSAIDIISKSFSKI